MTKAAIEREQSDACISSVERELARPKGQGRKKQKSNNKKEKKNE
jgi:hypothetical protein